MRPEPIRFIYILASQSRVLYTGITSDLQRRVYQHKRGLIPGFTRQCAVHRLVCFESTSHIRAAIERERQIKSWRREKKLLSVDWFSEPDGGGPSPSPSPREGSGSG